VGKVSAGTPSPFAIDIVVVRSGGVVSHQTQVFPAGSTPRSVVGAFPAAAEAAAVTPGLAELRSQDAAFEPTDFLTRAVAVVSSVLEAQRQGHPDQASGVMSDRLYSRWKAGAAMSAPDPTYAMRGFWIAEARSGSAGDTVAVRMQQKVFHAMTVTVWVFVRSRAGQASPSGNGAICPNCGAPVPKETATCPFCHAAMFRSSAEWVLDDMVPVAEWTGLSGTPTAERAVPPTPPSVPPDAELEIRPRWPHAYLGLVITATGQQLVCRKRFHPIVNFATREVSRVVLCGVEVRDGSTTYVHPGIFFFNSAGRCLISVFADRYRVTDFDQLFQRIGVAPEGSWRDSIPISKLGARFPGAFDKKAA
jgi:hypothetical protein